MIVTDSRRHTVSCSSQSSLGMIWWRASCRWSRRRCSSQSSLGMIWSRSRSCKWRKAVVPSHHLVWYDLGLTDSNLVSAVVPSHHLVWYDSLFSLLHACQAVVPSHHLVWYDWEQKTPCIYKEYGEFLLHKKAKKQTLNNKPFSIFLKKRLLNLLTPAH